MNILNKKVLTFALSFVINNLQASVAPPAYGLEKEIIAAAAQFAIIEYDVATAVSAGEDFFNGEPCEYRDRRYVTETFQVDDLDRGFLTSNTSVASSYYDEVSSLLYVSFHGSHTMTDWVNDALASGDNNKASVLFGEDFPGEIHHGYAKILMSIKDKIIEKILGIQEEDPECKVIFCGHSLGGALASLAGTLVESHNGTKCGQTYAVVSSAPQNIGDDTFIEYAHQILPKNRIINLITDDDFLSKTGSEIINWCNGKEFGPMGTQIDMPLLDKILSHINLDDYMDSIDPYALLQQAMACLREQTPLECFKDINSADDFLQSVCKDGALTAAVCAGAVFSGASLSTIAVAVPVAKWGLKKSGECISANAGCIHSAPPPALAVAIVKGFQTSVKRGNPKIARNGPILHSLNSSSECISSLNCCL